MPSPSCRIPCRIISSDVLLPLANDDGLAYLPTSIPAVHSTTSEESARALLATPTINPRSRAPYFATQDVALRAIMPWLDRELDNFGISKSITIQYPLDLREAKGLVSVAHRTTTEVSWQVSRIASIALVTTCTNLSSRSLIRAIRASAAEDSQYVKQGFESPCQLKMAHYDPRLGHGSPPWTSSYHPSMQIVQQS